MASHWSDHLLFVGECLWLHIDLIKGMQDFCRGLYPVVDYAYTTIPTYPSGQIGFILCGLNPVSIASADGFFFSLAIDTLRQFTLNLYQY